MKIKFLATLLGFASTFALGTVAHAQLTSNLPSFDTKNCKPHLDGPGKVRWEGNTVYSFIPGRVPGKERGQCITGIEASLGETAEISFDIKVKPGTDAQFMQFHGGPYGSNKRNKNQRQIVSLDVRNGRYVLEYLDPDKGGNPSTVNLDAPNGNGDNFYISITQPTNPGGNNGKLLVTLNGKRVFDNTVAGKDGNTKGRFDLGLYTGEGEVEISDIKGVSKNELRSSEDGRRRRRSRRR